MLLAVNISHVQALPCAIWLLFTLGDWHILPGRPCSHWRRAAVQLRAVRGLWNPPRWGCALFCLIPTLPLSAGLFLIMLSLLAASSSPSQDDRCVGAWLLSKTWWMCDRDSVIPLGMYCMWKELYLCVSTLASQSDECGFDILFFFHMHPRACLAFCPQFVGFETLNCVQGLA